MNDCLLLGKDAETGEPQRQSNMMQRLQTSFTVLMQREQLDHTSTISQAAICALDAERRIYCFAVENALSTLEQVGRLKQARIPSGMPPELEPWFRQTTQEYLDSMTMLAQERCEVIMWGVIDYFLGPDGCLDYRDYSPHLMLALAQLDIRFYEAQAIQKMKEASQAYLQQVRTRLSRTR